MDNIPDDERRAGYGGGSFPLRALILLLLASAFISGFLAGVLAMLWFVIDCMQCDELNIRNHDSETFT